MDQQPDLLAHIRLNREEAYKSGSNGDMFITAWNRLSHIPEEERLSGKPLIDWLSDTAGVSGGLAPRAKTILTDHLVSGIAVSLCRTAWGREKFQIHHFDELCSAKVKQVSTA